MTYIFEDRLAKAPERETATVGARRQQAALTWPKYRDHLTSTDNRADISSRIHKSSGRQAMMGSRDRMFLHILSSAGSEKVRDVKAADNKSFSFSSSQSIRRTSGR
jgi:hypothetical protein